ncbi:FAD/NAD(P)-binding protein [Candidatus Venteria ishoeyi]|uniref:FAD/NAD(P)-binding protein n=1 Tax=Candidatus Venteria ishoeyi TaxID=1899563 RepID=UPI0025A55F7D|nr:FAD/NAD(P)-binding protein [Candidatus Venteria ishoeyi]MDM8545930.1 FAD/NAD(P)-binding protein [Candidatus Venteria ishoeyi]
MSPFHVPSEAIILERIQESPNIFTLRLQFADNTQAFKFMPGQFNMLYLYGVGEVAISIVSDPLDDHFFAHTIRVVGRTTEGLSKLKARDCVGIRGPFGRGWPMLEAEGKDLLLVTGGLGCAPLVSVIEYIMRRREQFAHVDILQGVKHADDMIWRKRYAQWAQAPDVNVLLTADLPDHVNWPGDLKGNVVQLFKRLDLRPDNSLAMLCGPELMMKAAITELQQHNMSDDNIWLSLERNMHCGIGQCGHCQMGEKFVCKDGPVFAYPEISANFHLDSI